MKTLEAKNLSMEFGGLKAVTDFSLYLDKGELLGLIGPNGAGKTTVFNMLTGVYKPTRGEILLEDEEIQGLKTNQIVKKGVSRTFQNIRLFKYLSVLQNVLIAYNGHLTYNKFDGMLRTKKYFKEEKEARDYCMDLLKLFGLDAFSDVYADNLPYGGQRKLEIARALATSPRVLLLDEPAAGMNPKETEELMATISFIRDKFDIAILLIEHDMKLVLGICERLMVLDHGNIIAQGDPNQVVEDERVIEAYLGKAREESSD